MGNLKIMENMFWQHPTMYQILLIFKTSNILDIYSKNQMFHMKVS